MGLLTGVLIVAVVLVIIGIGIQAFFTGFLSGVEKITNNPMVKNVTESGKSLAKNITEETTSQTKGADQNATQSLK